MDQLISAARIGRSLGVHLVLATQKPSGVVNDQIWSNARFKVCLKVADAADSREMLRRPEAAELTDAGRYYLMVGHNEHFALGQSAWAGTPYRPKESYEPPRDDSVVLISNTARPLAQARPAAPGQAQPSVPESVAILDHLVAVAGEEGLAAPRLWLDPLPGHITVDELEGKYAGELEALRADPFRLEPILGELDDPESQEQRLLTLPLSAEGNAVVYGASDAGAEALLSAMLFSLITCRSPAHVNVYIFDFGAETLNCFEGAPQVGGVVLAGDDERVSRTFDLLEQEVAKRRKLVAPYGSFERYCSEAGDKPAVLLVINGIAAMNELYDRYEPRLVALSRDGGRVGIRVLITATAYSEVRMRLRSNFKLSLTCGLANPGEYADALGSVRGIVPPKAFGSGLVRMGESIFAYQGAQVRGRGQDEYGYIAAACRVLSEQGTARAPAIPVLPERVDAALLESLGPKPLSAPIGIFEDSLELASFDFEDKAMDRVLFSRTKDGVAFIGSILGYLAKRGEYRTALLDGAGLFESVPEGCPVGFQDGPGIIGFFDTLIDYKENPPEKRLIVFVSGIAGLLSTGDQTKTPLVRLYLRHLRRNEGVRLVLFDTPNSASYSSEDWFRSQMGSRDGIWVGEGLDGQSALQVTYGLGERIDPAVRGPRGYVVSRGRMSKVRLISGDDDEERG